MKTDELKDLKLSSITKEDLLLFACVGKALGLNTLELWPDDAEAARKMVGDLIRISGIKPKVNKWDDSNLEAVFEIGGIPIKVNRYRPRTCRLVTKTVKVPAKPALPATEAIPEHTKEVQVIECDPVAED